MALWLLFLIGAAPFCSNAEQDFGALENSPIFQMAKTFMKDAAAKNEGLGGMLEGLDFGALAGAAAMAGGGSDSRGDPRWNLLASLAPLLLNQGHEHSDDPSLEDYQKHQQFDDATEFIKPFLLKGWEMIRSVEPIASLLDNSGLKAMLDLFTSAEGNLYLEQAVNSLENPQFRKKWLRSLVSFVAEYVKHISSPEVQKRYMVSAALAVNSILKTQGYSDRDFLQPGPRFVDSLISVLNNVAKKNIGMNIDSAVYILPVTDYVNSLVTSSREGVSRLSQREIEDKLADKLNEELVETILRVYRAYRYSLKHHKCDRYLMCTINQHPNQEYVIRPVVTKVASVVASWFLSGHTGTSFWNLYSAATEDHKCELKYPTDCSDFHAEDIRIRTAYYEHNEL